MDRFVLRENIKHFEGLLARPMDPSAAATVRRLLTAAHHDLASLEANEASHASASPRPADAQSDVSGGR